MTQDELKQTVARAAIDYVIPKLSRDDILGIGTGSTANYFIDMLSEHREAFTATVASSEVSAKRLKARGIAVKDLNDVVAIHFYIDGADESNPDLQLIKGGGGALTREKIVAACAREFICIADESKWVNTLGKFPLPVEVIPMSRNHVSRELRKLGGNPVLRSGVVTDNGCEILDIHDMEIREPIAMEQAINQITGVVTNGLFAIRPADVMLLSTEKGVHTLTRGI